MLTEEEVTAVMESDSVKEAFYECAAISPHPKHIELSFIVDEKGQATLYATTPELGKELFSCFRAVSRVVEFEGKGKKFEITYPMKLPPHLEVKPKKKKAKPLKKAGWVLFGLGGAVLIGGGVTGTLALLLDKDLKDKCPDKECGPAEEDDVNRMKSLALSSDLLLGVGGAMAFTGIIMLIVDKKSERKNKGHASLSLSLPAGFLVTWKF